VSERRESLLRTAFLAGAVTDALALIPMLSTDMAQFLWGFDDVSGSYRFAMGYGASLMAAWTILLGWAWRKPTERAFVAALTAVVIYGLVATEIAAVLSGTLPVWRMLPTWALQAVLLGLFVRAYHYPALERWRSDSPLQGHEA
jgi:hypothetical protein